MSVFLELDYLHNINLAKFRPIQGQGSHACSPQDDNDKLRFFHEVQSELCRLEESGPDLCFFDLEAGEGSK